MTTLAAALVRQRALPIETVEQAMLRQSLFGGDLSTNLLELGSIDERTMLAATAAALEAPPLAAGRITAGVPELVALFPASQLLDHPFLPLASHGSEVVVAAATPLPPSIVEELEGRFGKPIALRAALEVRIRQAIADELGLSLDERTANLLAKLDADTPNVTESDPSAPPSSSIPTPRVSLPASAMRSLIPKRSKPKPQVQARRLGPVTTAMAEIELTSAQNPGDVIAIWLDFAAQYFEYTAVFAVQGDLAAGKAARGKGTVGEAFSRIGVPLDLPSTLQRARSAATWLLTSLEPRGLDRSLARDLGRGAGRQILVLPITIRERVVMITYGDHGNEDVLLDRVGDVLALCPLVERHLERLLVERKRGVRSQQPPVRRSAAPSERRAASVPDAHDRASTLAEVLTQPLEPPADAVEAPLASVPSQPQVEAPRDPHEGHTVPAPAASHDEWEANSSTGAAPRVPPGIDTESIDDSWDLIQPVLAVGDGDAGVPVRGAPGSARTKMRDSSPPGSVWPGASTRPGIVAPKLQLVDESEAEIAHTPTHAHGNTPMLPPPAPTVRQNAIPEPHAASEATSNQSTRAHPSAAPTPITSPKEGDSDDNDALRRECLELLERSKLGDTGALKALVAMGDPAAAVLVGEMPGPVAAPSRFPRAEQAAKASEVSPLFKAIAAFGAVARPYVIARTSDADAKVRVWSIRLLGEMAGRQAAMTVAQRIVVDRDAEVRRAAYLASTQLLREPDSAQALRQALLATAGNRQAVITQRLAALDAIADLRDAPAIPSLIELLADPNPGTAAAAQQALTVLARQDFGYDAKTWKVWWNNNKDRDRIEWVIDALDHRSPAIRQAASEELRLVSRLYVGNFDDDSIEARTRVQKKYREWWAAGAHSPSGRPSR